MGLKYFADMKYAPLSELLRQDNIKTGNQLMALSSSSWKYCSDTGRIKLSYIIFDQRGSIYHGTHAPGTLAQ